MRLKYNKNLAIKPESQVDCASDYHCVVASPNVEAAVFCAIIFLLTVTGKSYSISHNTSGDSIKPLFHTIQILSAVRENVNFKVID